MGDCEESTPVFLESPLKYHPLVIRDLTWRQGHRLVGSLTGVVASKRVTEAFKGTLSTLGNRTWSASAQDGLTARLISRAGAKAGASDPVIPCGRVIAQQIKGTPGITG